MAASIVLLDWPAVLSAQQPSPATPPESSLPKSWEATAPGRIEPRSQETRIGAFVAGRIAEVLVRANDRAFAGELLARLDDEEALARLAAAEAQVALRLRARDEQRKKGSAERRRADDAVADAERSLAAARLRLDEAVAAAAHAARGPIDDAAVTAARESFSQAQDKLRQQRDALRGIEAETGLPTRVEAELDAARADLTVAEAELEKTRIRAPFDGTVLRVDARAGEAVTPSPDQPLILFGDLSALRVRAELDERDVDKVRVGQGVVVRADAFKDRVFLGTVQSKAQFVGPGRISSHGQRNKLSDVDVVEVVVDLKDPGPLLVGMQADVYFRSDGPDGQGSR